MEEDEKFIFEQGCCMKRKVYPFFVYTVVIMDTIAIIYESVFLLIQILNVDGDEQRRRVVVNENLVWTPERIAQIIKLYYGYRWLLKGQSRELYIPFYRMVLTANSSQIIGSIFVLLVTYQNHH